MLVRWPKQFASHFKLAVQVVTYALQLRRLEIVEVRLLQARDPIAVDVGRNHVAQGYYSLVCIPKACCSCDLDSNHVLPFMDRSNCFRSCGVLHDRRRRCAPIPGVLRRNSRCHVGMALLCVLNLPGACRDFTCLLVSSVNVALSHRFRRLLAHGVRVERSVVGPGSRRK